jgi:hypothetical protein
MSCFVFQMVQELLKFFAFFIVTFIIGLLMKLHTILIDKLK